MIPKDLKGHAPYVVEELFFISRKYLRNSLVNMIFKYWKLQEDEEDLNFRV